MDFTVAAPRPSPLLRAAGAVTAAFLRSAPMFKPVSLVVLAGLLLTPAAVHASGQKPKRPNILFIMSDDHASAAISAYGSWLTKIHKTPHIDRLARGGMRFTSALVTNSICTRRRAAILPGPY